MKFDTRAVDKALAKFLLKTQAPLEDALVESIKDIQKASNRMVPVDTGDLLASSRAKVDLDNLKGGVGYAHPSAPAAHENPKGRRYRNGKKAKFLESAVNDNANVLVNKTAAAMKKALS